MIPISPPLQIVVYQDVLCAWCYVAEQRLDALARELGGLVRISYRPFSLRPRDQAPTTREIAAAQRALALARREPEAAALRPDLWTSNDLPRSTVPPLMALEAARLQGPDARAALSQTLRRAALEQGVNVTRTDVLYELAGRVGLKMDRFAAAFRAEATRRRVLNGRAAAAARGVRQVPAVVLGGRWMVTGLRALPEYGEHVLGCFARSAKASGGGDGEPLIH
jgi:predicted DsbA family dithiol-disulfide isomerase